MKAQRSGRVSIDIEVAGLAAIDYTEDDRRELFDAAVVPKTFAAYHSCVRRLRDFTILSRNDKKGARELVGCRQGDSLDGFVFSQIDYANFMLALRDQGVAQSTADGFRAAVLHFQHRQQFGLLPGEAPWADSTKIKKLTKGVAYASRRKLRGAITYEMMADLINFCMNEGWSHCVAAIQVQFHTATRRQEVQEMRVGDMSHDRLLIRVDKRLRAINDRQPEFDKEIVTQEARDAFAFAEEGLRRNDKMFSRARVPVRDVRAAIHAASAHFGWEEELGCFFSGHSLRHGGAQRILSITSAEVADALADVLNARRTHMSAGTRKRYGKPNAKRAPVASGPLSAVQRGGIRARIVVRANKASRAAPAARRPTVVRPAASRSAAV
jgi:integrase